MMTASATADFRSTNDAVEAESSDSVDADNSWGFFNYIKTKWNQLGSWRIPGLYDDIKAKTGRDFGHNELSDVTSNVNIRFNDGSTPLTRALKSRDQTTVETLLKIPGIDLEFSEKLVHGFGCVYDEPASPPLIVAVKTGNFQMVKILLDAGASVNTPDEENYTALYHSVDTGNTEMARLMLEYSPVLECPRHCYDPIHVACKHGHLDIVKLLVKAGCNVEPDKIHTCITPLQTAIGNSFEDICLYLLENGADINNKGNCDTEPFLMACNMGLSKVVDICIQKGCDINMISKDGLTALMLSTKLYNYVSQRSRLFQTSDVKFEMDSLPPDTFDLYRKRVCVVKSLCEAGCRLDTTCEINKCRVTAVSLALKAYNLPVVVLLLGHGATWDAECQRLLTEMYGYLQCFDRITSLNVYILNKYIPKVVQLLDQRYRMQYYKDTDENFAVPCLKDMCRQVIRQRLKQNLESNFLTSSSILPLIPSLNLPALLEDYLCFKELFVENYSDIDT